MWILVLNMFLVYRMVNCCLQRRSFEVFSIQKQHKTNLFMLLYSEKYISQSDGDNHSLTKPIMPFSFTFIDRAEFVYIFKICAVLLK